MDASAAIIKKTPVKKWSLTPVEKERIEKVLVAGKREPLWGNTQPWCFMVILDRDKIEELAKL